MHIWYIAAGVLYVLQKMGESIIIHFRGEDLSEISQIIDDYFISCDSPVIPGLYHDYYGEYDEADQREVRSRLIGDPDFSFDFQIIRSRSDEACDLLEGLIRDKLMTYNFVVDDMFRCLSSKELIDTKDFLDVYRYKKQQAEQVAAPDG